MDDDKEEDSKIKELEKRIADLEKRPIYIPYTPPIQYPSIQYQTPPHHWHNGTICYQNPCVWC